MRALIQRVSEASVTVAGDRLACIDQGLLVLLGVERGDERAQADRMLQRLLSYRVFADAEGRMNRSVRDIGGAVLLVSQFTLAAQTDKGTRPGFSGAAEPRIAESLYDYLCEGLALQVGNFGRGRFGADMQVALINDGPVTFLLEVR